MQDKIVFPSFCHRKDRKSAAFLVKYTIRSSPLPPVFRIPPGSCRKSGGTLVYALCPLFYSFRLRTVPACSISFFKAYGKQDFRPTPANRSAPLQDPKKPLCSKAAERLHLDKLFRTPLFRSCAGRAAHHGCWKCR